MLLSPVIYIAGESMVRPLASDTHLRSFGLYLVGSTFSAPVATMAYAVSGGTCKPNSWVIVARAFFDGDVQDLVPSGGHKAKH